jgi:hypothetical protein
MLYQQEKSTVAGHSIKSSHQIKFHETKVLARSSGYMDQLVKEATKLKLHLDNINREE